MAALFHTAQQARAALAISATAALHVRGCGSVMRILPVGSDFDVARALLGYNREFISL